MCCRGGDELLEQTRKCEVRPQEEVGVDACRVTCAGPTLNFSCRPQKRDKEYPVLIMLAAIRKLCYIFCL
jgi:hypothetical protein